MSISNPFKQNSMKKNYYLFATFLLSFASCGLGGYPLENKKADNNNSYNVQYLFEHDGCKVYRFMDMGNYVYFTNCTGDVTAIKNDSTRLRRQTIITREELPR